MSSEDNIVAELVGALEFIKSLVDHANNVPDDDEWQTFGNALGNIKVEAVRAIAAAAAAQSAASPKTRKPNPMQLKVLRLAYERANLGIDFKDVFSLGIKAATLNTLVKRGWLSEDVQNGRRFWRITDAGRLLGFTINTR